MTNPNKGVARNAGDIVMRVDGGNLQVTTTGETNRKQLHLTIGRKGHASMTVALDQRQARMFTQHIIRQL